jgi:hypothetical protein
MCRWVNLIAAMGMAAGLLLATAGPAFAEPQPGPCAAAFSPLCAIVPVLPGLDHDIDLTKPADPATGAPALLEPVQPFE